MSIYHPADERDMPLTLVTFHQDDTWTVVELDLAGHSAFGVAKRHPDDESDPEIGSGVATARALTNLGKEIKGAAMDRVRQR